MQQLRNELNEVVVSWPRLPGLKADADSEVKHWTRFSSESVGSWREERQLPLTSSDAQLLSHSQSESVEFPWRWRRSTQLISGLDRGNIHAAASHCWTGLNRIHLITAVRLEAGHLLLSPPTWVWQCGCVLHRLHNCWRRRRSKRVNVMNWMNRFQSSGVHSFIPSPSLSAGVSLFGLNAQTVSLPLVTPQTSTSFHYRVYLFKCRSVLALERWTDNLKESRSKQQELRFHHLEKWAKKRQTLVLKTAPLLAEGFWLSSGGFWDVPSAHWWVRCQTHCLTTWGSSEKV